MRTKRQKLQDRIQFCQNRYDESLDYWGEKGFVPRYWKREKNYALEELNELIEEEGVSAEEFKSFVEHWIDNADYSERLFVELKRGRVELSKYYSGLLEFRGDYIYNGRCWTRIRETTLDYVVSEYMDFKEHIRGADVFDKEAFQSQGATLQ